MSETIGIVGMGVMGKNIALNFSDNGVNVVLFNKSEKKINNLIDESSKKNIYGFTQLDEFVNNIEKPRKILLMVPSGEATNSISKELFNLLEPKDILIDGGNSFYKDSIELGNKCKEKNISFIGMGVSGGETGARHGPALMLGSSDDIPENLLSMIKSISAKSSYGDCVGVYKGYGTGHFIKMLHNGIEYAEMQILAESYSILKSSNLSNIEISNFFKSLKEKNQSSYLIEISSEIIKKKTNNEYLIDNIKPVANNKGTGKLTVETSLEYNFPLPSIYEAFNARVESHFQKIWPKVTHSKNLNINLDKIENTIYFARLSTLIQGILFIEYFSNKESLEIKIPEVLQNWLSGCIIRSDLLQEIKDIYEEISTDSSIVKIEEIQNQLEEKLDDIKITINECVESQVALPVIYSSYNWYINSSNNFNPSSLIQAQRDFFGAHMVQLLNEDEFIHLDWV